MEIKTIFLILIALIVLALVLWGVLIKGVGVGEENPAVKIIIDWVHSVFGHH